MTRTDPAFMKFTAARDALKAYEQTHGNETPEQRLSNSEYQALYATFKFADKTAAEAEGNWG